MKGAAWEALAAQAHQPLGQPDLSDQDDPTNMRVLAKALYFVHTSDAKFATEVAQACQLIQGTERNANALAISRELTAYVIAADLIQLEFKQRQEF